MNRLYMKRNIQGELVSIEFLKALNELTPAERDLLIKLLESSARNNPQNAWTIKEVAEFAGLGYELCRQYLLNLKKLGFLEQVLVKKEGSPKRVHAYYVSIEVARKVNEPTHTALVSKISHAKKQGKTDLVNPKTLKSIDPDVYVDLKGGYA